MVRKRSLVAVGSILFLWCRVSVAEQAPRQPASDEGPPPIFEFHNQIGMNLHHFLYWRALPHDRRSGEVADWPETLDDAERAAVDRAVAYYRRTFGGEDLLFGGELYRIKTALAGHDGSAPFSGLGLAAGHAAVLDEVLPIYRLHLWAAHQAVNRRWIERAAAEVEQHGRAVLARLVEVYADPFPPTPIRVDVVIEGHWAGAYTTDEPMHVVVAGSRPSYQGKGALEMVFHEASHGILSPRRGTAITKLDRAFQARGAKSPMGLWHALMFYTVGRVVQDHYQEQGLGDYQPYAYANGLWNGPWGAFLPTLEREWQIYLEGRVTMDQAVTAMVVRIAGDERDI